jgi:hypothetical protein
MITAGASRVASGLLCVHAIAITPGRFNGACSLVCLHCQRPSPCNSKVGSCNYFFEACSAFTHVTACTLAESPSDPLHRELRQLCCLRCRLDCFRVERTSSRAGVAPAVIQRLSRRTLSPIDCCVGSAQGSEYLAGDFFYPTPTDQGGCGPPGWTRDPSPPVRSRSAVK